MSTPETTVQQTFNPIAPAADVTGLAVALGRIEEGQRNLKETIGEIKASVGGISETLGLHAIEISALKGRADAAEKERAEMHARHQPWYVIAGGIGSVTAIAIAAWSLLHP
jgi:hypothetical protein